MRFVSIFFLGFFLPNLLSCSPKKESINNYTVSLDTINFNEINYKDTFNKVIYISNKAKNNITITKIETACGCTSTFLKDSVIKMEDSIPLRIQYIPSYSNDSGQVIKFITLRLNTNPPFKNIILRGKIIK